MKETPAKSTKSYRYRWTQNHGNWLIGLASFILLVGLGYIGYQQSRFVPARFPDSDAIQVPMTPDPSILPTQEGDLAPDVGGDQPSENTSTEDGAETASADGKSSAKATKESPGE